MQTNCCGSGLERGKIHVPFVPLPEEDLAHIRAAPRVRLGCKPQTWSAVLELDILIPHIPLGVLSSDLSSPDSFLAWGLPPLLCQPRAVSAACPDQAMNTHCYGNKRMLGAPVHPWALREWILCFQQVQGSPPVPSTTALLAPGIQARSCALLSCPQRKPVAQPSSGGAHLASAAPLGQLQHELSSSSQPAGNLDVKEKKKDIYFSLLKLFVPSPLLQGLSPCVPSSALLVEPQQLMDFPLLSRGKTQGNNPKKEKLILLATCQLSLMGDCASGQGEMLAGVITGSFLQGYNLWLARPVFRYRRKRNHWINYDDSLPCINKDDYNWNFKCKSILLSVLHPSCCVMWENILTKSGIHVKKCRHPDKMLQGKIFM